jgi:hypothetical protein
LRKKRFRRKLLVFANIKELAVFVKEPMARKVISCMFEKFQKPRFCTKIGIYLSGFNGKLANSNKAYSTDLGSVMKSLKDLLCTRKFQLH